jgi:hypothetical protein
MLFGYILIYDDYRSDFAVLPCFAMFCQSFPLHFDGILGPLPVASGRPIQTWSIQALNPELAKQQKLGNSATESSRYTAVHGSTGGFSSGYERDSQVTDENPTFLFLVIAEKNPEKPKQIINQQGFGSRCSLNTPNPEPTATEPTPGGRLWLLPLVPQVRKPKSSPNPWCSSWEPE